MPLDLSAAPALEPLTVQEVADHLELDSNATVLAPDAPTVALAGAGAGNVDNGVHRYRVTFVTADGETDGGAVSASVTTTGSDGQVSLTNIPTGGATVTSRKVYRTEAGGSTYLLLITLADNTTTTYSDDTADSALGAEVPSTNSTKDPRVNRLIAAARMRAEAWLGRALIDQTWILRLDDFPLSAAMPIWLPLPPLDSVTSIAYVDTNGDSQTWAASKYDVGTPAGPFADFGRIMPAHGESYPATRQEIESVTITFVAGYGATAADVPAGIREGMLVLIRWLYDNPGYADAGLPQAVRWLWSGYRAVNHQLAYA